MENFACSADTSENCSDKILSHFMQSFNGNYDDLFTSLAHSLGLALGLSSENASFGVFLYKDTDVSQKLEMSYFQSDNITKKGFESIVFYLTKEGSIQNNKIIKKFEENTDIAPYAALVFPIQSSGIIFGYAIVFCHDDSKNFDVDGPQFQSVSPVMRIVSLACENEASKSRFQYFLMNDYLTGLPNRNHIYEALVNSLQIAEVYEAKFAILSIKVNGLKYINDSLGMITGDIALKEIGQLIKSSVLSEFANEDTIPAVVMGRMSSADFMVLIPLSGSNQQEDEHLTQAFCLHILEKAKSAFEINNRGLFLSTNIGACMYPYHGETAEELIRKADIAKSASRAEGPGHFKIYEYFMGGDANKILFLNNNLPDAINSNQFELFYQPQVDFETNQVVGAEALIRWRHPEKGLIFPGDFITFAEKTHGIQIDKLVLKMVCEQVKIWEAQGIRLAISVNITPRHFVDGLIIKSIKEMLELTGVRPSYVKIELLESTLLEDFGETVKVISNLRNMGIDVALDDFGAGYSSLEYVASLHLDYLKIDRTFAMNLESHTHNKLILETIMTLAKGMQVKTVVEGVENQNQFEFLRKLGCTIAQGYHIGKPMDVAAFEKFLEEKR